MLQTDRTSPCTEAGLLALLFVFVGAVAIGSGPKHEVARRTVNEILTADDESRDRIVDELLQPRKDLVESLISIVEPENRDEYSDETKSAAGYLLGELRAVEAVLSWPQR